ncbi:MAG TPA: hypothetical protein VFT60_12645 [Bryobacteraceae bacterium]|nr:hypothetical protein [Bryobacteraceae bacterium]
MLTPFPFSFFSAFVFPPVQKRAANILLLPGFRAAAYQNDELFSVFPKIDAISQAEVDPELKETRTDTLYLGEIPRAKPGECGVHLCGGAHVQPVEPGREWAVARGVNIFPNCNQR